MDGVMRKLYRFIAVISVAVRQFLLPNPFEKLPHPIAVKFSGISIAIPPLVLNIIAEPVIHTITFAVVGIYYSKGDFPAFGSLLYLLFYSIHVGLLALMAMTQFTAWAIILIVVLYIACHMALLLLINHRSTI